ncbi:MAG: DUF1801 domain-containing protein [Natronospirillum sp.]
MAELKTQETDQDVEAFLSGVDHPQRQRDARAVLALMHDITGQPPRLWGTSMVGFGRYRYRYNSGHEGEWFVTGFAPRKTALTLYIMSGFSAYDDLMQRLGKYKTGKSCLYVKRLEDIDQAVLAELIRKSMQYMHDTWG